MGKDSKLKRNFILLIILTLSGSFIYTLPYFRSYYYDAFMSAFHMTNTQMGLCGTYFGLFGAVSYLIGGVIADKFSIKKVTNHQFNWWFDFSPPKGYITTRPTGRCHKHFYWSAIKRYY